MDSSKTAFLVIDTESVPDGRLLSLIKYADQDLTPEQAIEKARAEARAKSRDGSDFLPHSYQYPVAVCVIRVAPDLTMQKITCLDAPRFRPAAIVKQFWEGLAKINATLVTFNGRGFDLPLLEMAAFRYGVSPGRSYFTGTRARGDATHFDLMNWFHNYGACHLHGGLNLLAKVLGKPGKMEVAGDRVLEMHREGKVQEINDYCICDTLDTYFAFLRVKLMLGDITLEREHEIVLHARDQLQRMAGELPGLAKYLANWGDWQPWP